jgi:tetratricopeptide (TPR) repeat protein
VQLCFALAFTNLILLIFNILPVYPLDGGNIFHSLMELLFGKPSANLITMIVSVPVLIALIVVGIYWHDYVLLGSTIFIALGVGTLNKTTLRGINLGANYLLKRGGYYLLKGDYDRAEKYYTRKIMREPDQADHYIARAIAYLWMLQKQKALADIEYALKLAPKNEMVILLRADLYALDKKYDSALALILQAQELKPNWAPALMDHGSVLMYRAEFQPALAEIDKAISLLTQIPLFYVERSIVHFKLGDLDAAHKDQDAALQLSEKDALIRADFNLKAYEGFLDWAEDYYARALLKLPRSWYAYLGWGDAYRANGEYDKAILNYTQALKINPREPRLYLSRGKCYQATGELNCAETDFRQVNVVTKLAHYRRHAEELLETFKGDNK